MKNFIRKAGKFYTRVIMKNIGIFIFVGLLSVAFNAYGWWPDENMYAISQLAYSYILPIMIAYEGGQAISGPQGGVLAILGTSGLLAANSNIGLFGAMFFAPFGGYLWKQGKKMLEKNTASSLQMLGRNLCVGITGGLLAACGFYIVAPLFGTVARIVYHGVDFLVEQKLVFLLSILIEPAKVFFMNNLMNHGILVPLGMNQVQELGQSCLFLLEVNPGPGLGVLAALWYVRKERRHEYVSAMFAEAVGGIHEVYFPYVLSDLGLLVPLIFGGITGSVCFEVLHAGLQGAVSPGSVVTILLLAGKNSMAAAAAGMFVSTVVSFAGSVIYLKGTFHKKQCRDSENADQEIPQEKNDGEEKYCDRQEEAENDKHEANWQDEMELNMEKKEIRVVGFVCDGGMGSSAMGAAIFRRSLTKYHLTGVQVEVYAADMIEEGTDLIVCQEDFFRVMQDSLPKKQLYTVSSFLKAEEYEELIKRILKSRG